MRTYIRMPVFVSVKENKIVAWQAPSNIRCKRGGRGAIGNADSPTCPVKRALFSPGGGSPPHYRAHQTMLFYSHWIALMKSRTRLGWGTTFHALLRSDVADCCGLGSNYTSVGAETAACLSTAACVCEAEGNMQIQHALNDLMVNQETKGKAGSKWGLFLLFFLSGICRRCWADEGTVMLFG